MEKRNLIVLVIIIILVAIALFFIYPLFTGNVVSGKYACLDGDGGVNYSVQGTINQGEVVKGTDFCTNDVRLKEYYCLSSTTVNYKYYICPNSCVDGACVGRLGEETKEGVGGDLEDIGVVEGGVGDVRDEPLIDEIIKDSESDFFQRLINWFKGLF